MLLQKSEDDQLRFVARRGKDWNCVMGHSRWTSGPGAAAARWL